MARPRRAHRRVRRSRGHLGRHSSPPWGPRSTRPGTRGVSVQGPHESVRLRTVLGTDADGTKGSREVVRGQLSKARTRGATSRAGFFADDVTGPPREVHCTNVHSRFRVKPWMHIRAKQQPPRPTRSSCAPACPSAPAHSSPKSPARTPANAACREPCTDETG